MSDSFRRGWGLIVALAALATPAFAAGVIHQVEIGQKIHVKSGDTVKLKGQDYRVTVSSAQESVPCAVPGFNCGAGYIPPHPTFSAKCTESPCPFFFQAFVQSATEAEVVVHTEESCGALKHRADSCFLDFSQSLSSVEGCKSLKSPLGRYHCSRRFSAIAPPAEFRELCGQLPRDIHALRENCLYDWATRYRDSSYCGEFDASDASGAERCWLKMAELLSDKSLCRHIRKEASYVEQCRALKTTR